MGIKKILNIVVITIVATALVGCVNLKYSTEDTTSKKISSSEEIKQRTVSKEGVTFSIPSSWQEVIYKNYDGYFLDTKGTNMSLETKKLDGISSTEYINSIVLELKEISSVTDIKTSTKTIDGLQGDIIEYKQNSEGHIVCDYQVVLCNNNTAYIFTLTENKSISDDHLLQFENLLDTIHFE